MMYKKISDFGQNIAAIADEFVGLNLDITTNSDPFPQIAILKNKVSDLEKSTSYFPSNLKKEMVNELKNFSNGLKYAVYEIFKQHIVNHIENADVALKFMINYPHLFSESCDIESSPILELYVIFWHFLADIYVISPTPEIFPGLCNNTVTLSSEQTKDLVLALANKLMSTVVNDIVDDVSDRDDEMKIGLVQEIRKTYPHASKNVNHLLLSKNKRNTLKQNFLMVSKNALIQILDQEFHQLFDEDFHQVINNLSLSCMPVVDVETVQNMFYNYVSLFLEEQFQKSNNKNTNKLGQKTSSTESMLTSSLLSSQKDTSTLPPLPTGLRDEISHYVYNKNINGNSQKLVAIIEKILQKSLIKKSQLRKQWFLDKIGTFGFGTLDADIFAILEKYGFSCVDDAKKNQNISESFLLSSEPEVIETIDTLSDTNATILLDLQKIDSFQRLEGESKKDYLVRKMRGYVDIFEQLGYAFSAKEKFIQSAAEYCYSYAKLDKDIKKIIFDLIVKNKQEQHRDGRNYYTFEMSNGRRILLSKKGIIDSIGSHDHYEKYLKNNY